MSPLIQASYIKPIGYYTDVVGNPYEFPLDFDNSDITNAPLEMKWICDYLHRYLGRKSTLANYTKEAEKFLQWLWRVKCRPLLKLDRRDAFEYLSFIQSPPYNWIAKRGSHPKFIGGLANPKWRPFTTRNESDFLPTEKSIRGSLSFLNGLYLYFIECDLTKINPFLTIKNPIEPKKSNSMGVLGERRDNLIEKALVMAELYPKKHERTLFIIKMLAHMDIKTTDLAYNRQDSPPTMNNFFNENGLWKFRCRSASCLKSVDVPKDALKALERYRESLLLDALPLPDDTANLLRSLRSDSHGFIHSSEQIRKIIGQVERFSLA
ncbi:MAG: hypothetical protein RPS47_12670 [Colwellia sp.]|jgi:hypothetical protein